MSGPSRRITRCRKNVLVVCRTAKGVGTHKLRYVQPGGMCSAPGELPRTIGGNLPANTSPHRPKPLGGYSWINLKGTTSGTPRPGGRGRGLAPASGSDIGELKKGT